MSFLLLFVLNYLPSLGVNGVFANCFNALSFLCLYSSSNVSTSPFTSRNLVAHINNVQGVFSVGNDDLGENDVECNLIELRDALDQSTGQVSDIENVTLPADAWKDLNMLDWVLSMKNRDPEWVDSTQDDFNDLMTDKFHEMSDVGSRAGHTGFMQINSAYMRKASAKSIDI